MGESHARLKRSVSQVSAEKNTDLGRCLEAIDLPKSTYYYRKNRSDEPCEEEQELIDHAREIMGEHLRRGSYYGYLDLPRFDGRFLTFELPGTRTRSVRRPPRRCSFGAFLELAA